jgi:uncharacterized protein (DUF779 family)
MLVLSKISIVLAKHGHTHTRRSSGACTGDAPIFYPW